MSTFNYPGPGIVRDGVSACPGGSGGGNYAQMRISIGSTVNVTFEGSPPFNLSRTVWKQSTGTVYCLTVDGGRPWNQSWYMWDVEPYQDNFTGTPSRETFQVENDGVVLYVTELAGTGEHRYFTSPNFTITPREVIQVESSGSNRVTKISNFRLVALVAVLIVPSILL